MLSRLRSACEEGLNQGFERGQLIGAIRAYQELLKQPWTPADKQLALSLQEVVGRWQQELAI